MVKRAQFAIEYLIISALHTGGKHTGAHWIPSYLMKIMLYVQIAISIATLAIIILNVFMR